MGSSIDSWIQDFANSRKPIKEIKIGPVHCMHKCLCGNIFKHEISNLERLCKRELKCETCFVTAKRLAQIRAGLVKTKIQNIYGRIEK